MGPRNRGDRRQQGVADDGDPRRRVLQNVAIVRRLPQRVDGNRDRPDLDGAEERVEERRSVEQEQHDPLARPDAALTAQEIAASIDALGELVVGDPLGAAFDGDLGAASLEEVPVDEIARRVELLGNAEIPGGLHPRLPYLSGE